MGTIFARPNGVMTISKSFTAHLSLLFCNIVWACDYPFYSLVLGHYISPLAMVSASLVIASVWSLVPMLWEKHERVEPRDRIRVFVAALLIGVSRKLCMMFGLVSTSPIDGSIISTTTPLLVLILSAVVGAEQLSRQRIVGVLLGLTGAVLVILFGSGSSHAKSGITGNLLILTSATISAVYMVMFKDLVSKYRVSTLLRWFYCISALLMLPIGAHDIVTTDLSAMDTKIILASLFVLIVPTYLPNLLLNYSLRFVAPTVTSVYSYLQPVVAIALAVAMGLDRLRLDTVLFALIIFIGVGLVIGSYREKTKKVAH